MKSDRGIFPPHEDYAKETASGFHIERKVVESEAAVVGLVDWVNVALNSGDLGLKFPPHSEQFSTVRVPLFRKHSSHFTIIKTIP